MRMAQDDQGFMWLAGRGLHRYDGYSFKTFLHDPEDSTSLSTNELHDVYVDREGTIWVGGHYENGGLHRYHPETESFTRYQMNPDGSNGLSENSITVIYEDHSGTIWAGTEHNGLNRFDKETETFTTFLPNPDGDKNANRINSIIEDVNGTLWIGASAHPAGPPSDQGGLFKLEPNTQTLQKVPLLPPTDELPTPDAVYALFIEGDTTLWVGPDGSGLVSIDLRTNEQTFSTQNNLSDILIYDLTIDRNHIIWIGAGNGLYRFDRTTNQVDHYQFPLERANNQSSPTHPLFGMYLQIVKELYG